MTTTPRHYHGDVSLEDLLDELVPGGVDQLDDVAVQGVPVLLQEAWAAAKSSHTSSAQAASRPQLDSALLPNRSTWPGKPLNIHPVQPHPASNGGH